MSPLIVNQSQTQNNSSTPAVYFRAPIMDVSYQEHFERFVAEMRGSSKDVPLRPVLETNFHYTLARVDDNKADEYLEAFADDVTLIHETKNLGTIFKGKQELASYFRSKHLAHTRIKTVPIVTIVDRDRITCYAEQYLYHGKDGTEDFLVFVTLGMVMRPFKIIAG
ncbi:hypothetical protein QIS74_04170 [Colletotrichum tabaci]|uniref:SnoaL-like domain-containing protein n=1 Tax=Colletotrichum tabaci TaxID=1209068 RepID=A0AAV9TIY2_9PEZI